MPIPKEIIELIDRFKRNRESYQSGKYNETQVRLEFIDPFFKALGWDIHNEQGYAEAYKDVIHEDAIKIGAFMKAPDYCFRIGGTRKFFLEAKKPSVNLKDDLTPAFQLRRYAWSAKLSLSILTDFEEFAVYDCRVKPVKTDKASTARIMYLTYNQYIEQWNEIADVFSRDAVLKGSFDKYAVSTKRRGTAEVDVAFLKEIESWREMLARNIALRNPQLTTRELNYAVQQTIDRIIFLRICEDRGIEQYGHLMQHLNGEGVYKRLWKLFRDADARYNSGLFHFEKEKDRSEPPDELTPTLAIDDKPLKEIIKNLYYPDSAYEFSVLPADILGQVYEQFLGKVIRLTAGHRAVVEDKPEVKKAGGVYYTPTYIVDYIVKNTLGKLLEGKKPAQVAKLKILDPACGSGSFLIGAYQYLLDWHLEWYMNNNPKKWAKGRSSAIYQVSISSPSQPSSLRGIRRVDDAAISSRASGTWRLTTAKRKEILLNNIYGVDIDTQAVEVTKLSLLLKVLEGETQLSLFHERALPDLGNNIKCGNSLIGPDFYDNQQLGLLVDEEERYRINAFDWDKEFPEIMQSGGFNAVIGNPPYVHARSGRLEQADKVYYANEFETAEYQINTYALFLEQGMKVLSNNSYLGMIVPNYWLSTDSDSRLRHLLFLDNSVREIANVFNVFANATVDTLLIVAQKTRPNRFPKQFQVKGIDRALRSITERLAAIRDNSWAHQEMHTINSETENVSISFAKQVSLKGNALLKQYFDFKFGMKPYEQGKGEPAQTREMMDHRIYDSKTKRDETYKPLLRARNVRRYHLAWAGDWIKYGQNLAAPRDPQIFEGPRILIQRIVSGAYLEGTYTDEPIVCNTDVITLKPLPGLPGISHIYFVLGILLSRACAAFLKGENVNLDRAAFPKINANTLENFPLPQTASENGRDQARYNKMVELVEQMLELHKQLAAAKTPNEQTAIQRQIDVTDHQIDQLVYELYDLTDKEIKIVEESAGRKTT